MKKIKIALIGATGNIGKALVPQLVNCPQFSLLGLARTESSQHYLKNAGIEVISGDLALHELDFLRGVDKVFLNSAPGPHMVEHQCHVLDKCAEHNVKHIVKISVIGADRAEDDNPLSELLITKWHAAIEDHARELKLPITYLRPSYFMQNLEQQRSGILDEDQITSAAGSGVFNMIDIRDVARAIVCCLDKDGTINQSYILSSLKPYTFDDIAGSFSKALNKKIKHNRITPETLKIALIGKGLPEWAGIGMMEIYQAIQDGHYKVPSDGYEVLTGEGPLELDTYCQQLATSVKEPVV